ncbi:MAG: hypothetical protein HY548_02560, partial [Elusimicrobia bacterium]|nr:hypothetical protein [Elusimicrobiota bacterium]
DVIMPLNVGTYFYRVRVLNGAGEFSAPSPEVRVVVGDFGPNVLSEAANYPNPFDSRRQNTVINYTLSLDSDVEIEIYDLFGGLVRKMSFSAAGAGGQKGANDVTWAGTDENGHKVSKGLYAAVIKAKAGGPNDRVIIRIGVIH